MALKGQLIQNHNVSTCAHTLARTVSAVLYISYVYSVTVSTCAGMQFKSGTESVYSANGCIGPVID